MRFAKVSAGPRGSRRDPPVVVLVLRDAVGLGYPANPPTGGVVWYAGLNPGKALPTSMHDRPRVSRRD
jgi:hypothetical protein